MDHLLNPAGRSRPHPEIDYICSKDFTIPYNACFETYPESYGFKPDALLKTMDFSPMQEWQADTLMQEWLFFVLLADLFQQVGIDFNMQDFIYLGRVRYKGEPERHVVTSKPLRGYLQKWYNYEKAQMQSHDGSVLKQVEARELNVFKLIEQSQTAIINLTTSGNRYVSSGPFMFSLICLVETIRNAALVVYGSIMPQDSYSRQFCPADIDWPSRRMINNGSCPNHVRRLHHMFSNTGVYFASSLYLPEGAVTFDHSDCSELQCEVNYLDLNIYKPKHKCASGDCPLIGPIKSDIRRLLAEGRIPILGLSMSAEEDLEKVVLEVLSSEEVPYTAISHVWSDGRGNLQENSLPTCQLRYLCSVLQGLSTSSEANYFWIDTLCVPIEQPLRREAIGLMRRTYQEAMQVLVLDSSLELATSKAEPEEILIRVQTAGWMRRLWTLQEGALARKLLVQFRETAVDLYQLGRLIQNGDERRLQSWLAWDAFSCTESFQSFKGLQPSRLLELVRALQWRSTSWQQDETVCLSILLDLDVKKISSVASQERMGQFLSMIHNVPFQLAFLNGARLQQRNFRWAPSSLMPSVGVNLPPAEESILAVQTKHGLAVEVSGLQLRSMPRSDISWFRIEGDERKYSLRNIARLHDGGPSWTTIDPDTYHDPAIILQGNLWSGLDVDDGILVDVRIKEPRMWMCDYISRVLIHRDIGEEYWHFLDHLTSNQTPAMAAADLKTVTRIDKRKWCIQ